jgi:hypothetical protein
LDFVAKPSLFQSPAHGFVATDLVVFWGDNLPAGLTQGTRYFVIATGLTADAFAVSTTSGGASITLTGNGSGRVAKDGTQTVTRVLTSKSLSRLATFRPVCSNVHSSKRNQALGQEPGSS